MLLRTSLVLSLYDKAMYVGLCSHVVLHRIADDTETIASGLNACSFVVRGVVVLMDVEGPR